VVNAILHLLIDSSVLSEQHVHVCYDEVVLAGHLLWRKHDYRVIGYDCRRRRFITTNNLYPKSRTVTVEDSAVAQPFCRPFADGNFWKDLALNRASAGGCPYYEIEVTAQLSCLPGATNT
jgi:hypothetical protein